MSNPIPLLLETIKIEGGEIHNLAYHQKRFDTSRKSLYGITTSLDLNRYIKAPSFGLYRCRILYNTQIQSIEYIPYKEKDITTIQLVNSTVDYSYKYANRDAFDTLLSLHSHADDVLIVQDGMVTDTSIANIAFYDGQKWVTPTKPLLRGTMRDKLLHQQHIQLKDIYIADLATYTHVALMNAMIGFKILKNITLLDTKGKRHDY